MPSFEQSLFFYSIWWFSPLHFYIPSLLISFLLSSSLMWKFSDTLTHLISFFGRFQPPSFSTPCTHWFRLSLGGSNSRIDDFFQLCFVLHTPSNEPYGCIPDFVWNSNGHIGSWRARRLGSWERGTARILCASSVAACLQLSALVTELILRN